jgi:tRNA synthetases class I (I, L, M and V)
MVRDKYGRKMSKSLGNVIDPLEVINGCTLGDLLAKIDEGNLPAKEVCTFITWIVCLHVCLAVSELVIGSLI